MSDPCGTLSMFDAATVRETRTIQERTEAITALLGYETRHPHDRELIIRAVLTDADGHAGRVNPNRVRATLTDPNTRALTVHPQLIGRVYALLHADNVLVFDRYVTNDDIRGGNNGKPARAYRLGHIPTST